MSFLELVCHILCHLKKIGNAILCQNNSSFCLRPRLNHRKLSSNFRLDEQAKRWNLALQLRINLTTTLKSIGLYLKRKRCLSCPPINVPVFFSNCPITVNLVTKCPVMKGKLWNTSTHIIVVVACIKNDLVLSLQTYCGVLKFEGVCEVCVAYTSWATFLSKLCITYCITKNWTPEVCATRGQFIIFYS